MNPSVPAATPAEVAAAAANAPVATASSVRLSSIDAYRGLVMFLMMAEVLSLHRVSEALPRSEFWKFLAHQQSHVEWVGCTLHDLIQPSFSFLVGVALPFSLANRMARGQTFPNLFGHAALRAFTLIFLGIFLRSIGKSQTNYTFEDTLTQIGLGYTFLFLIGRKSERFQWGAVGLILIGYWTLFAMYPLPGPDFDWAKAGVAADWPHHLTGFAAHWNKNTNPAWAFDTWFMNLFPREKPFLYNGGGYSTLSFVPTLATMLLGSIAGMWLRRETTPEQKIKRLALAGVAALALGWILDATGVCPNVKKIWTPTWVIFSAGWCFLFLAAFYALVDFKGWKRPAFFLIVIGMNSIAAYCMEWLFAGFVRRSLETHLGKTFFNVFGAPYYTLVQGTLILAVLWLILFWMYRRKIIIKI